MKRPRSPLLRVLAAVGAGALVFTLGVVAGAAGSDPEASGEGVLDEVAARIGERSATEVDVDALERAGVEGMLDSLDDRWAAYYDAAAFDDFQQSLGGRYSGVGVWLQREGLDVDGPVSVTQVQPLSAADEAGLAVGDQVVEVDGVPVQGRPVSEVVADLRGRAGSTVTVTLADGSGRRGLTLQRRAVDASEVTVQTLADGVLSVRVRSFTRGVADQVSAAVSEASPAPVGVVLDLRGNPGGLLDEAVATAGVFLDGGPVVSYARRDARPQVLRAGRGGDMVTPLAVLVDGATASAAEVVAGALQDRGRAVVVGTRSFGKGSVQEPVRLSDGSALELTVGRYLTPSGRSLDGVGLVPDVDVASGSDPQVAVTRAREVLVGLLADAGGRG